jgi:hypothetical protein
MKTPWNLLKHLSRAEYKNGVDDYLKAAVYLDWLIQHETSTGE